MQHQTPIAGLPSAAAEPSRARADRPATRLSYKFQRLRERLRQAITSGELTGKLPGERALALRFHVNAKTLSKALTDLAAEGLLDRSIGRGTYVKGSQPAATPLGRWLILCDAGDVEDCLVEALRRQNADAQVSHAVERMRPSFLNQFTAVLDLATATPEAVLRDLVVRGVPVISVGHEARTYSMPAVLADIALAGSRLGRDLLLAGHRRLGVIERPGHSLLSHTLRQTAQRFDPHVNVETSGPGEIASLIDAGVTALVCDSIPAARRARHAIERHPALSISLSAVGYTPDDASHAVPCSGYFVSATQVATTVANLLRDSVPTRPATLWLAGTFVDQGTLASAPATEPALVERLGAGSGALV